MQISSVHIIKSKTLAKFLTEQCHGQKTSERILYNSFRYKILKTISKQRYRFLSLVSQKPLY